MSSSSSAAFLRGAYLNKKIKATLVSIQCISVFMATACIRAGDDNAGSSSC